MIARSRRQRRAIRRRVAGGFSTIEALAASLLTLMTVGSIFAVQQAQLKAYAAQRSYSESQMITRSVIDLMTRELRMAGYDPSLTALQTHTEAGCVGIRKAILEATTNRIRFQTDLDSNGAIAAVGEDVTYDVLGTQIRRTAGGVTTPLVDNIQTNGLAFRYFNNDTPPTELVPPLTPCQLAAVSKIRITVRADVPSVYFPMTSLAESEIAVRNRSLSNI